MQSRRLSENASSALDNLLEMAVAREDVPMVVAVVADHENVLYRGAFGTSAQTIFRIASMTKPVTSVSIMMLIERGLLALDDRLDKHLPEYANWQVIDSFDPDTSTYTTKLTLTPLTIRHLLTHTAGFAYGFNSEIVNAICKDGRNSEDAIPLLHEPGARWTYGCSTRILGRVVDSVTGQHFYEHQKSTILDPLGMVDTDYFLRPEDEGRFAPLYSRSGHGLLRASDAPFEAWLGADGGLTGTADDYIRFLQMLLNKGQLNGVRIISEQSVSLLTTNQIGDLTVALQPGANPETSRPFPLGAGIDKHGLGFQVKVGNHHGMRAPGSFSWAGLFNTHFWADPVNGIAVVMLTRLLPFYDDRCINLLTALERCLYEHLV